MRGTETILLVDNDDAVREIATIALRRFGYTVVAARTAEEALEWVASGGEPDVLLTDVVVPEIDGPTLAQRCVAERPDLQILFISGYADMASLNLDSPNVSFLSKPFQPSALAMRAREILDRARPLI